MGQPSVTLTGSFRNFVTFYVSSIDLTTLESDVEIFNYRLSASEYPVEVTITFDILINSPALGLSFNNKFAHIVTYPFFLFGPIQIKSTDLKDPPDPIYYTEGDAIGGSVEFEIDVINTILDDDTFEKTVMMNQIIQSGRLPDGTYRFDLSVSVAGGGTGDAISESIIVSNPVSLELVSPGGLLEDTTANIISTSYPFFQWQSDPCALCDYLVRVAQYKADEHSSVEDAIEDQTVLPLRQADEFYNPDGNSTSFQYPFSDAIDLVPGLVYVWQVKKIIPTTAGDQEILSFVNVFKILDPTAISTGGGTTDDPIADASRNPVLGFLLTAMGDDQFSALFNTGGELDGFRPTDVISINGVSAEISDLTDLAAELGQGDATIISVEVE
ncbi:MAG: hypothetical protein IIA59_07900 [Candidatus Marinimicrobia bacterium]|nr:hypothetical protein [Candidatus Neomarinimicrobiota bacterium]